MAFLSQLKQGVSCRISMKDGWEQIGVFRHRVYPDYDEYVERQSAKLESKEGWCRKVNQNNYICLLAVLREAKVAKPGMSVLCLAARLGGEVRAYREMGCFAVGIDVNPGKDNGYVVNGDFHQQQFADSSIDLVYLNCVDHAQDPYQVFMEIHRVLKPNGVFHFEIEKGYMEKSVDGAEVKMSDAFDCLEWAYRSDVVEEIKKVGFIVERYYEHPAAKAHPHGYIFRRIEAWPIIGRT